MKEIEEINKKLEANNYISNNQINTTLFLAFMLKKPILIEGPPGTGKTELAKTIAESFDRDFFRIQCYEGITFEQVVGEWNYQKQLLYLELARENKEDMTIFSNEFFIQRPLLTAFSNTKPSVLLIDEIDKADEELESFLLQALGEQEITVNDLDTFELKNDLIVVLTSNAQRTLLDETKDRCLYLYIDYPEYEREVSIVNKRVPLAENNLVDDIVEKTQKIRKLDLSKKPSIRSTVDWVRSLIALNEIPPTREALENTLNVVAKNEEDKERIINEVLNKI
ncbi:MULTISPECIES: MoxR family ATPase [Methanosphaera]|jgi:MoxR-like ATPase|uniref:Predicted MoxR-like ATPase n=2 Tax=Methanosphaera stadtmanae TaxID=2317 RepID=Q2NHM4_METST|nr:MULTISPECIES: MoxR family ATPase [Methanosphaera]ABC56609.1 predicted MoxR-like ATPase [Methanosphaera stadtmanae DSM 3091]MDO5821652.1 MoxR family ATPase [Methanosphaera sp.]MEE0489085.1 MoxR family ATPase [Methanosphaera stadtmanae]